jgi:PAB1-binding protein PBP1
MNTLNSTTDDAYKPYDQFEENKRRFGTTSTYDETLYTTKIDNSKITPELEAKAERIQKELV